MYTLFQTKMALFQTRNAALICPSGEQVAAAVDGPRRGERRELLGRWAPAHVHGAGAPQALQGGGRVLFIENPLFWTVESRALQSEANFDPVTREKYRFWRFHVKMPLEHGEQVSNTMEDIQKSLCYRELSVRNNAGQR